ncbi:MAG: hypothetical protein HY047_11125, partial [Acidobacteria bacterium]|nr:hypothetical protein [Acidobacteriota bacterium]
MRTRASLAIAIGASLLEPGIRAHSEQASASSQAPVDRAQQRGDTRHYDGPPVMLLDLLREAAEKNPELAALRQQIDVT